jgi:hypothetical protein
MDKATRHNMRVNLEKEPSGGVSELCDAVTALQRALCGGRPLIERTARWHDPLQPRANERHLVHSTGGCLALSEVLDEA